MNKISKIKISYFFFIVVLFLFLIENKIVKKKFESRNNLYFWQNHLERSSFQQKINFYKYLKSVQYNSYNISSIKKVSQASPADPNSLKIIFNILFQNYAVLIDRKILSQKLQSSSKSLNIIPSNFFKSYEKKMILFGIKYELLNDLIHVSIFIQDKIFFIITKINFRKTSETTL